MAFTLNAGNALLTDVFAPWVQALALRVIEVDDASAVLQLPFNDSLCRVGGILCGQSLMALADTSAVIAVCCASGGYRDMATVDQSIHLMKPVANQDVLAHAVVSRMGRSMAFIHVTMSGHKDRKAIAMSQLAYSIKPVPE